MIDFNALPDDEWIQYLTKNDADAIAHFFYKKYKKIFYFNLYKIFPNGVEQLELTLLQR